MYVFLPPTMFFLFRLALTLDGRQAPRRRAEATLVYVLHPWCIVLVRGAAKLLGLRVWLVDNALVHALCVCALSAALAFLQGGTPAMCAHAAAMTFKSVLGLACDPVGGLVECPCIKRNGILVANGTLCADMALAGIESVIPLDEVIDSMGQIGRMMAPALRETSQGGLAVTQAAAELMRDRTDRIGG